LEEVGRSEEKGREEKLVKSGQKERRRVAGAEYEKMKWKGKEEINEETEISEREENYGEWGRRDGVGK
jgi:hypothetical protein